MSREEFSAWIQERFKEVRQKHGIHRLILQMSTKAMEKEIRRDSWLRAILSGIALIAAIGLGAGWRGSERSAALQLRLMRAREMNAHLQEKNIAAAGLAHETRNPLNIVRGLAQMITKEKGASDIIRLKATHLIEEVDRVTSRLNEFIDYSKPREAKLAPTRIQAIVADVERMLESDKEDKEVQFSIAGPDLTIEADESLLRQVLFNLLLNAFEAIEPGGKVEVVLAPDKSGEATLEVRDNGPGVPAEAREEIFRPYYTINKDGTGLGLAVVWQIVRAHHWEIAYVAPDDGVGAQFRVSGLKVTRKTAS